MQRTSILLPKPTKQAAQRVARARGLSLGALIRQQLDLVVAKESGTETHDPLFDDFQPYTGAAPKDLAQHHDQYLYGDVK